MSEETSEVTPEVQELRTAFIKYWDGIKTMLMNLQIEKISETIPEGEFVVIPGTHKVMSRPLEIGNYVVKIGFQNNEMRLYDKDNKAYFYPVAGEKGDGPELFWKEILSESINDAGDLVDFITFYTEIFDTNASNPNYSEL